MSLRLTLGAAAAISCFLQLAGASHAQPQRAVEGPCRIEGGQSGLTTWRWDIYMKTGERCWQAFDPMIIGVERRGSVRCGTLRTTESVIGWDYAAGPRPCIDHFVLNLVVSSGGEQMIITAEYTVNIEPR